MAIFIILIVIIANSFNSGVKNYSDLEQKLVSATQKYMDSNEDLLPTSEGKTITISSDTLVSNKFIEDLSKLYSKDTCTGEVKVTKVSESYLYIPNIKCNDYSSKSLSSKLLENVVETSDGLYKENNEYIFKGEDVNNYVKFSGKIWRIIKLDSSLNIKIYLTDKKLDKTVWDDRYNLERKSDYGKNTFESSRIKDYLLEAYESNKFVDKENIQYLVLKDWCIGSTSSGKKLSEIDLCSSKFNVGYIGLFDAKDYASASLEKACINFDDVQCINYNYLADLSGSNWTLTASSENTHQVYAMTSSGVDAKTTSKESYLRPVIYLNKDVLFTSGTGTEADPYIIK